MLLTFRHHFPQVSMCTNTACIVFLVLLRGITSYNNTMVYNTWTKCFQILTRVSKGEVLARQL